MASVLLEGLRTVRQRWMLVALLVTANLVAGLVFALIAGSWLTAALGGSLASRTLLSYLDPNLLVDLFVHHRASLRVLCTHGLVLALTASLVWVWLNASAIAAVGSDGRLGAAFRQGTNVYPKILALWLATTVAQLLIAASVIVVGRVLTRWTAESGFEMTPYWVWGGALFVGAWLVLFVSTVHDHARIHCVGTGSGATRALAWSFAFVAREAPAMRLSATCVGAGLATWAIYQSIGLLLAVHSGLGLAVSLLWGQCLMLVRTFLRVWLFAAETVLQVAHERDA